MIRMIKTPLAAAIALALSGSAFAATGPSTSTASTFIPTLSGVTTTSVLTTGDSVGGYTMGGIPDGLGAYDNGDNTFTVVMNHEWGNTSGSRTHASGLASAGAYQSKWVISKTDFAVSSGSDLITSFYGWSNSTQSSNTSVTTGFAFNRFCSADLPKQSALYNALSGKGSQQKIFFTGEEGGSTGYALATVVTGSDAGKAYQLGKFNLTTNGSGLVGVGAWENIALNSGTGDKTVAIGNNDGGTGIMAQSLAMYFGDKQSTGSEVEKAGLMNGITKFISVTGNAAEISNSTTRTTGITSGTAFTLSGSASTAFSRPEDGAWNPNNANQYYFVTTDRLDQVADGIGTQIGMSRLWRLNFNDAADSTKGGTIDLLIDGGVAGTKINMFDNMTVDAATGHIVLEEDVGGAAHNGKIWDFDPTSSTLTMLGKHDPALNGDIGVTAPVTNDEEFSGIIDITDILGRSDNMRYYLTSDQQHNALGSSLVEGGQLLVIAKPVPVPAAVWLFGSAMAGFAGLRRKRA